MRVIGSSMGAIVWPLGHFCQARSQRGKKGKGVCKLFMEIHLTTTECHLPYGITQCYLPPDTSEHTRPLPQPDRLVLDLPTI